MLPRSVERDASKWAAQFQNICKRIANVGGHVPKKIADKFPSNSSSTSQKNFVSTAAKAFLGDDSDEPAGETSVDGDFAHRRDM